MVFGAPECFLHHPCCFQCSDQPEIRLVDFEYDVLTYARGLFFCHAFPSLGGFQLRPPLSEVQKRVTGGDAGKPIIGWSDQARDTQPPDPAGQKGVPLPAAVTGIESKVGIKGRSRLPDRFFRHRDSFAGGTV